MAKITNDFYLDGIVGANVEMEKHDLPANETVNTSDNFAAGILYSFPMLTIEPDGTTREELGVEVKEDIHEKVGVDDGVEYEIGEPEEEVEVKKPVKKAAPKRRGLFGKKIKDEEIK